MTKLCLSDLDPGPLRGCEVFVRVDFNAPISGGIVADDTRLRSTLPTLNLLSGAGARVVLASHRGRPGGHEAPELTLAPVAAYLGGLLNSEISFVEDTVGEAAREARTVLRDGEVLLLENTRFAPEEPENDPWWSGRLAGSASLFVNDAFGTAHRAHASTVGVAESIKASGGVAVAGCLLERELHFLGKTLENPKRPFIAALGGAKISGKIDVIEALLPRVDRLLIGGAMANTFLMAMGMEVGASLVEVDRGPMARELMERAGDKLMIPVDVLVAEDLVAGAPTEARASHMVESNQRIGDIGPETASLFGAELRSAGTVLWNGPMGVFEVDGFGEGTLALARAAATAADAGTTVVVGGGDSAAAAASAGVEDRLTHISTGGGAALEFLAGADLPGVEVLSEHMEG